VFTGDLLASERTARSLPPFPMYRAFPGSEYYGGSATPRRQQRTVRLPRTRRSGGHHRDASHVHQRPVGRVDTQLYPCGIAARHRNTPRGLANPICHRMDETASIEHEGPSTATAHIRQFPGW
jgi:hypothetical protein